MRRQQRCCSAPVGVQRALTAPAALQELSGRSLEHARSYESHNFHKMKHWGLAPPTRFR